MVLCNNVAPSDAIQNFEIARGHEMERENYIEGIMKHLTDEELKEEIKEKGTEEEISWRVAGEKKETEIGSESIENGAGSSIARKNPGSLRNGSRWDRTSRSLNKAPEEFQQVPKHLEGSWRISDNTRDLRENLEGRRVARHTDEDSKHNRQDSNYRETSRNYNEQPRNFESSWRSTNSSRNFREDFRGRDESTRFQQYSREFNGYHNRHQQPRNSHQSPQREFNHHSNNHISPIRLPPAKRFKHFQDRPTSSDYSTRHFNEPQGGQPRNKFRWTREDRAKRDEKIKNEDSSNSNNRR